MDNQIQNKLSQFEIQPPEAAWERLAGVLDEKTLESVGSKLSQFEVLPEESNWNNITAQLAETTLAKVIPFHRRYAKHIKYGSAVAVFAAVALIANLMISKKTESEPTVKATVKKILNTDPGQLYSKDNTASVATESVVEGTDVEVNNTSTNNDENRRVAYANIKKEMFHDVAPTLREPTASSVTIIPGCAEQNTIAFSKDADRYMAYSLENGNAIRLPKKMYDAITCPNKDAGCLQKIKQLQEKMASSTMLTDFTGVLDMLDNLGENQ